MKILVLGVSGMIGNAVMRVLSQNSTYEVWGSARSNLVKKYLPHKFLSQIITGIDVKDIDALTNLYNQARPDVVINCIGLVKQHDEANDPLNAITINALLPHRLSQLCKLFEARLIHISTDCVFSGRKGGYVETDETDPQDFYGRSKLLGEVTHPHTITLRTSVIGHELNTARGLINWFLSQEHSIKGYTRMIFSGLTNYELARVIGDFIIPKLELNGLYHLAAEPISKYELLKLVNQEYEKDIVIEPYEKLKIDRSLNGNRFQKVSSYTAPSWPELISQMRVFQ